MHRGTTAALLLFTLLSLVLLYPLPLHLANAVEDRQDALLNVWITAWDGHRLLEDPLHLFDANIFYPYPRTLAYSELLLGNALLALPILAVTGNPVLGYNLVLLLSFLLSGLGAYLLVLSLTRSRGAGLVAGTLFAFSAYRMTNLAQAQLLTTQWMPFALLALVQLMRSPRPRHAGTFALFFCLQALSSFYYAILLALLAGGFLVYELAVWVWDRVHGRQAEAGRGRSWVYLLVATAGCALVLLPFVLPYFQVQRELGFERSLADSEPFSASLGQYLMVPSHSVLYGKWLPSDDTPRAGGYPVDALFPGLVALALAALGLIRGQGPTRWFFLLALLAAFCLSLGPRLYLAPGRPAGLEAALPYAWLYAIVPGFKAMRAPVRFDAVVMLSLSVLAGYGVAALLWGRKQEAKDKRPQMLHSCSLVIASEAKQSPSPKSGIASVAALLCNDGLPGRSRRRVLLASCILLLVVLELVVWPAAKAEPEPVGDGVPQVYHWLAQGAPGPILELPMAFTPGGPQLEYQYFSTYHWRTTPDGYSGFIPPKHGQIVYEMERFPSERSISLLQALGVRYVVIHSDRIRPARWLEMEKTLAQASELTLVETLNGDRVYEVQPRSVTPDELAVSGYLPPLPAAGQPYTAYLIAANEGPRSYAIRPTDVTQPGVAWRGPQGTTEATAGADVPLVTSPDGGAAVIPLQLVAPDTPGVYELKIGEEKGPLGSWDVGGTVKVVDSAAEVGDGSFPVPARLQAWDLPQVARPGEPLPVALTWRALGKIDAYYSVYVKVMDAQGNVVAGWDGQPQDGAAPTLLWAPGETVEDAVTIHLPADMPPGEYNVEVGMYRAEDLARALTLNAEGVPVDRIVLGTVRVEE